MNKTTGWYLIPAGNFIGVGFMQAFIQRRPWAAALIGFVFGPTMGMFYLGQGRMGLGYLLLEILVNVIPGLLRLQGMVGSYTDIVELALMVAVRLVAVLHCFSRAASLDPPVPAAWFARWHWWLLLLIGPMVLALLVRSLLWEPFHSASGSMLPTMQVNDYFFVAKYAYGYTEYSFPGSTFAPEGEGPKRGDIVVFRKPGATDIDYVKRVIGLPGDRVSLQRGILQINGQPVRIRIISAGPDRPGPNVPSNRAVETLANGIAYEIYQGDPGSPMNSTKEYQVPDGHYFMLGDNRDNSLDSRFDQVGFVPRVNIIGRMDWIF